MRRGTGWTQRLALLDNPYLIRGGIADVDISFCGVEVDDETAWRVVDIPVVIIYDDLQESFKKHCGVFLNTLTG